MSFFFLIRLIKTRLARLQVQPGILKREQMIYFACLAQPLQCCFIGISFWQLWYHCKNHLRNSRFELQQRLNMFLSHLFFSVKFVMNTDTAVTHPIVRDLLQNIYGQVFFVINSRPIVLIFFVYFMYAILVRKVMNWPENTHRWGKDHCTAGLQLNKTGTDQWRKYNFICI